MENIVRDDSELHQLVNTVEPLLEVNYIAIMTEQPSTGEIELDRIRLRFWAAALHHLLKLEWNYKHKFPKGFKGCIAITELFGKFLQQTFFLCEKCHGRQALLDYRLPYNDAGKMFQHIYHEIFFEGGILFLLPKDIKNRTEYVNNKDKKRNLNRKLMSYCRLAKDFKNPYKSSGTMKHFSTLLDAAIQLSCGQGNQFNNQVYQPFLTSWQNAIKALDKPAFQTYEVINGDLVIQGRGPGRATKTPLKRSGSQKPLLGKGSRS